MQGAPEIPDIQLRQVLRRGPREVVYLGMGRGRACAVRSVPHAKAQENFALLRKERALARLSAPSLPLILNLGMVNGRAYSVSEHVTGESLRARLNRSGKLFFSDWQAFALELVGALQSLHRAGFAHGHVCAENVLFVEEGSAPRLVDYHATSVHMPELDASMAHSRSEAAADVVQLAALLFEGLFGAPHPGALGPDTPGPFRAVAEVLERVLNPTHARPIREAKALFLALRELIVESASASRVGVAGEVRARELELLTSGTQMAGGGVFVVRGPSGSGKTYLAERLIERRLAEKELVLRAACEVWDASPFRAVRGLFESFLDLPGEAADVRAEQLRRVAGEFDRLVGVLSPRLRSVFENAGDVPRSDDSEHIFVEGLSECLARLLVHCAQPLVILEDSQWLDEASRKVLKRLVERRETCPLRLLVTMRDDRDSQIDGSRLLQRVRPALSVALAPLQLSQTQLLVSDYLGRLPLPDDALNALTHLSDGTPLSLLEMVRLVSDAGLLTPNWTEWQLDAVGVSQLRLPSNTLELLARRAATLSQHSTSVLLAAAVWGRPLSETRLAYVSEKGEPIVRAVLGEAQQAQLVEPVSNAEWRFVHRAVPEALLQGAERSRIEQFHRLAARSILSQQPGKDLSKISASELMALARHVALGRAAPELIYKANLAAGLRAFETFDNAGAVGFFEVADQHSTASSGDEALEYPLGYYLAEALLRQGHLAESLAYLEQTLTLDISTVDRALLLSRMAWIAEIQADTQRAVSLLSQAFMELGEAPPKAGLGTAFGALRRIARAPQWRPQPRHASPQKHRRAQVISAMHYHSTRLAFSSHNPALVVETALRSVSAAEQLGTSAGLAKAYGVFSILLTGVGQKKQARRFAAAATQIAEELNDPAARAHDRQLACMRAIHAGDIDEAFRQGADCLTKYSSWIELNELCLLALSLQFMESFRGRGQRAWDWSIKGLEKALAYEGAPAIAALVVSSAEAEALHLGILDAVRPSLEKLRAVSVEPGPTSGWYLYHLGSKLRLAVEQGKSGAEFEAIVEAFNAGKHDPKKVYIGVSEYYIQLAHARVHQAYRAPSEQLSTALEKLRKALADLKVVARIPLFKAHAAVIGSSLHVLTGNEKRARRSLALAEELGRQETAPWVLYAAARARAHQFRMKGDLDSARDQARIAQALAFEHGAVHRQRWVEEEFDLPSLSKGRPSASEEEVDESERSPRSTRHLRALVNLSKADSRDMDPKRQAQRVLDELIGALFADRGFLWMRAWGAGPLSGPVGIKDMRLLAGRDAEGNNAEGTAMLDIQALTSAMQTKSASILTSGSGDMAGRSLVISPLLIQEQVVGAACLVSFPDSGHFTPDDVDVFSALVGQVPVALQLAHALRDRDRLTEDLRHAQKMDAVGRLAGGISHDFNNMLSAIKVSADAVLADPHRIEPVREELITIRGAADRATRLTRQLLTFSRKQVIELCPVDLNNSVRELMPMMRKLVGPDIEILEDLDPRLLAVWGDATQLEQAIVNLVLNAKDAMPDGGSITICSDNELFDGAATSSSASSEYAVISVSDTGAGMSEEIRQRVFEPFFTTKGREQGTGLGLAMVYGIVRQCGGLIDIKSAEGSGTSVRICLPRTTMPLHSVPPVSTFMETLSSGEKILLVEDERLVRQALGRVLRRLGYKVFTAVSGAEALAIAAREENIGLVITDVIMPGMNGVELIRRLRDCGYTPKVLYISGFTDGVLVGPGAPKGHVEFMQKPVSQQDFAERVRRILNARDARPVHAE